MKTPAEARQMLIAALESGEFKQGQRYLCMDNCHCCLGVACELFIRDGGKLSTTTRQKPNHDLEITHEIKNFGESSTYLPKVVQDWLGFASNWGQLKETNDKGVFDGLASLNDDGRTFAEIAQVIREGKVALVA